MKENFVKWYRGGCWESTDAAWTVCGGGGAVNSSRGSSEPASSGHRWNDTTGSSAWMFGFKRQQKSSVNL